MELRKRIVCVCIVIYHIINNVGSNPGLTLITNCLLHYQATTGCAYFGNCFSVQHTYCFLFAAEPSLCEYIMVLDNQWALVATLRAR
jgi:hypothetical protein